MAIQAGPAAALPWHCPLHIPFQLAGRKVYYKHGYRISTRDITIECAIDNADELQADISQCFAETADEFQCGISADTNIVPINGKSNSEHCMTRNAMVKQNTLER